MQAHPLLPAALFVVLATGIALLAAYLYFEQHLALEPCRLCWWQRYAHMTALAAGVVAAGNLLHLQARTRLALVLLSIALAALLASTGLALWHVLTEAGVIPVLVCASPSLDLSQAGSAFADILERKPVRCDLAPWTFLGLSIAGWNLVYSACATAALAFLLLRTRRKAPLQEANEP